MGKSPCQPLGVPRLKSSGEELYALTHAPCTPTLRGGASQCGVKMFGSKLHYLERVGKAALTIPTNHDRPAGRRKYLEA
jgi:hypothetical protein